MKLIFSDVLAQALRAADGDCRFAEDFMVLLTWVKSF